MAFLRHSALILPFCTRFFPIAVPGKVTGFAMALARLHGRLSGKTFSSHISRWQSSHIGRSLRPSVWILVPVSAVMHHSMRIEIHSQLSLSRTLSAHKEIGPGLNFRFARDLQRRVFDAPDLSGIVTSVGEGCYLASRHPARLHCSQYLLLAPHENFELPYAGVWEFAMLFHGPMVSMMILIPANALLI